MSSLKHCIFETTGWIFMVDAPFESGDQARSNGALTVIIRFLNETLHPLEYLYPLYEARTIFYSIKKNTARS